MKLLQGLCLSFCIVLGTNSALADISDDTQRHHSRLPQIVLECGDMETAVANVTVGLIPPVARQPAAEDELITAAAASLFFSNFQACECRARLAGEWDAKALAACVIESKFIRKVYLSAIDEGSRISEMDLADLATGIE